MGRDHPDQDGHGGSSIEEWMLDVLNQKIGMGDAWIDGKYDRQGNFELTARDFAISWRLHKKFVRMARGRNPPDNMDPLAPSGPSQPPSLAWQRRRNELSRIDCKSGVAPG